MTGLGDNFYDQDGRLTKRLFDELSLDVKSTLLEVVAGNHDIWVCGGPGCGDKYDQAAYGMMQWYPQDPVVSAQRPDADFFDFSVDPDHPDMSLSWNEAILGHP